LVNAAEAQGYFNSCLERKKDCRSRQLHNVLWVCCSRCCCFSSRRRLSPECCCSWNFFFGLWQFLSYKIGLTSLLFAFLMRFWRRSMLCDTDLSTLKLWTRMCKGCIITDFLTYFPDEIWQKKNAGQHGSDNSAELWTRMCKKKRSENGILQQKTSVSRSPHPTVVGSSFVCMHACMQASQPASQPQERYLPPPWITPALQPGRRGRRKELLGNRKRHRCFECWLSIALVSSYVTELLSGSFSLCILMTSFWQTLPQ
jgi:hypothetical protein